MGPEFSHLLGIDSASVGQGQLSIVGCDTRPLVASGGCSLTATQDHIADGRCEGTNVSNVETQFTSGLPPVVLTRMVPIADNQTHAEQSFNRPGVNYYVGTFIGRAIALLLDLAGCVKPQNNFCYRLATTGVPRCDAQFDFFHTLRCAAGKAPCGRIEFKPLRQRLTIALTGFQCDRRFWIGVFKGISGQGKAERRVSRNRRCAKSAHADKSVGACTPHTTGCAACRAAITCCS